MNVPDVGSRDRLRALRGMDILSCVSGDCGLLLCESMHNVRARTRTAQCKDADRSTGCLTLFSVKFAESRT